MVKRINGVGVATLALAGVISAGLVSVAVSSHNTTADAAAHAQRAQDAIARKGHGDVYASSSFKSKH